MAASASEWAVLHLAILICVVLPGLTLRAAAPVPNALLLDGAVAGSAVIAVGERGTILRSTDNGQTWAAAKPPTLATLTGVTFADTQHGWAVGHDAIILASNDGGATWTKQWQGENLTDSFLDVLAIDTSHVIAIGAYGLYLSSGDAGKTWTRQHVIADDYHLNRISRGPTGTLYIAGEHGTLLRSADAGQTWKAIPSTYEGSFYGVLPIDDHTLLAYGLRGRLFRSDDDGASWSAVDTRHDELIATGAKLRSGVVVLAGQLRQLLVSEDDYRTFLSCDGGVASGIAELIQLPDQSLLAFGEAGARRIEPPQFVSKK